MATEKMDKMLHGKELSMIEDDEEVISSTPVMNFYKNKTVFLTGGTGFIGKLLLQKLLKLNVKEVVLLSRPKKGKSNDDRFNEIFSGVVFRTMKDFDRNFSMRVKIVDGDMQKCNLGLSDVDRNYIVENVQIVVHAAADVRFDQALKKAIEVNVRGTRDLLRIMEKSQIIEALVYVSTVYCNCPYAKITEMFYPPPSDPEKAIAFVESMDNNFEQHINRATKELIKPWPNTYVYTKSMAEDIVRKFSERLPIAVVRPSIVISTCEDPVAGWTDNIYGLNGVITGVALGVIRVMVIDDDAIGDIIPADYVVNTILAAAWNTFEEKREELTLQNKSDVSVAKIYNCISSSDNPIDWRRIYHYSITIGKSIPAKSALWIVSWTTVLNLTLYNILRFFYHIIPAFFADAYLSFKGEEPKMMKLYNKVHKFSEVIAYFANCKWTFDNTNTKALMNKLTPEDRELFQFDVRKIVWKEFFDVYLRGLRRYIANESESESDLQQARKQYNRRRLIHNSVKYSLLSFIFYLVYLLLQKFLNIF